MARDDKERIVIVVSDWEQEEDSKRGWAQYTIYDEDGEKYPIAVPSDRAKLLDEEYPFEEGDELHLTEGGYDRWILTALPNEEPGGGSGGGRGGKRGGGSSRRGRSSGKSSGGSRRGRSSSRKSSDDEDDDEPKRGRSKRSGGRKSKDNDAPDVNTLIKFQEYMKICATIYAADPEHFDEGLQTVIEGARTIDEELNG